MLALIRAEETAPAIYQLVDNHSTCEKSGIYPNQSEIFSRYGDWGTDFLSGNYFVLDVENRPNGEIEVPLLLRACGSYFTIIKKVRVANPNQRPPFSLFGMLALAHPVLQINADL